VEAAYEVLKNTVTHTPLQHDRYLSEKYQANVYLNREDLQKVRSFKLRGAYYAMHLLPHEVAEKGVVCASAGNHAQGVAYTAREMDVPAMIFMPKTTPKQKIDQVKFFGGENVGIALVGDTFDDSAAAAIDFAKREGQTFVDPFNDFGVMAGQGTSAVEIYDDAEKENVKFDYLFAAIGGGGLISGLSAYSKYRSPETKIIGVEPKGAPSMQTAFDQGHPVKLEHIDKFVDGASVAEVGAYTYEVAKQNVDDLLTIDEGAVSSTILELYARQAIVAEPAGALSVSALDAMKHEIKGKTVVCMISGGNNDINRMAEMEERSLIYQGLMHYFVVNFPQRPGALREFVNDIIGPNDDITRFEYVKKVNKETGPLLIGVLLSDKNDYAALIENLAEFDPKFIDLQKDKSLYTLLV
jgi:threonine dehydratase